MVFKNHSAVEKVMQYAKSKIINGEWVSGQRLPVEADLCEQIGISRSGLREALKILEASHIVEIKQGSGSYIGNPDDITFLGPLLFKLLLGGLKSGDIYEFREAIEMAVILLAISNSQNSDLEKLEKCNQGLSDLLMVGNPDPEKVFEIDVEFHEALGSAVHNSIMKDIYLFIFQLFAPLIQRNYEKGQDIQSALDTHKAIVEAIKNKNLIMAGYAVHLSVGVWKKWIEVDDLIDAYTENFMDNAFM
ncbi:MAG: FadR/GntR family transcriptional regulator [Sphaerochaetaceae bacterium]